MSSTTAVLESADPRAARVPTRDERIRVAVIGCGAVARQIHLPILAGHEQVDLAALVDRDVARAGKLARAYKVPRVVADLGDLPEGSIDAAVIATPPVHHAPAALELIRRGIHVLVEKPMATTAADAAEMVRSAEARGVVLAVGFFRRLMPSVRLLRGMIDSRWLGRPVGVEAEAGGFYGWQAATLANMHKASAGGGVLIDFGSHILDLLHYVFPGETEVLEYRDDSHGGVEADCDLRLRLYHQGGAIDARVGLARTRKLGGFIRVRCERGSLEYRLSEQYKVWVAADDVAVPDPATGKVRPHVVQAGWSDEPDAPWHETMRSEFDDWLGAIRTRREPQLSGRSSLTTVRVIDDCYRRPAPLPEPWVTEGLDRFKAAHPGPARTVLVTGASGFIGTRVAEVLHLGLGWKVRGLVHSPSGAARLARLPVEMVQGDLKSPADMARAVAGCDAVVHCAVGTAYGQRREIFAVTVGGTRNLAEAAREAGVKRFVHLSSIAVHGNDVRGDLDETTPIRPPRGDDYSESKAKAEEVIRRAVRAGLPAVMLRPGNVYGPFSKTFVVRPMEYLARNGLVLAGSADTPSNTVYVDNLVAAILRSLEAPAGVANGQAFTISDDDDSTWGDFYGYFARELGLELRTAGADAAAPVRRGWGPLRWLRSWVGGTGELLTSPEFRALGRRFLERHPLGRVPRKALEGSPALDRGLRRLLKTDAVVIHRRPETAAEDVLKIRPRDARIRMARARQLLGAVPAVPRERAMALTLDWVRHARLARGESRE
jgi:predicted dehydrogenase/nucleoside-diphosphate-sugar epimerase